MAQQIGSTAKPGSERTVIESRVVSPPNARVVETVTVLSRSAAERLETKGKIPGMAWDEDGEWFHVGDRLAPEGSSAARQAIQAKRAGDEDGVLRHATAALEAVRSAPNGSANGRDARRANAAGNPWSNWYEAITGRPPAPR